MSIEYSLLKDAPVPLDKCPGCGASPFDPFLRGEVQRSKGPWWAPWRRRPYCALICWNCKDIVGYEYPPGTNQCTPSQGRYTIR